MPVTKISTTWTLPFSNLPVLEAILDKANGQDSDNWDDDPTITEEE